MSQRSAAPAAIQPLGGGIRPAAARFTPDSNWIVYHDKDGDGKYGLYRVSISRAIRNGLATIH